MISAGSGSEHPAPRQIRTWRDAEHNAAAWMRYWGYRDARANPGGSDGGIDVCASDALAQVKYQAFAVGRPALQLLFGARGHATHKQLIFFTGSDYASTAVAYADEHNIALFVYSLDGSMAAVNASARRISTRRSHPASEPRAEAKPSTVPSPSSLVSMRPGMAAPDARAPQPALRAPGPVSLAILLAPFVMCLVGAVTIWFFSQNPDLAPPWLREVWATWMTVACLGALPALLVSRFLSQRQ
ncbi:restriction endonuclease [Micromonospora sp. NPDC007271]|uniref:restriction endonuclease n=1 Tax=Micromonospora sp. NPDC007271 TaxID=3154587 RepID=UPI0033E3D6A8